LYPDLVEVYTGHGRLLRMMKVCEYQTVPIAVVRQGRFPVGSIDGANPLILGRVDCDRANLV